MRYQVVVGGKIGVVYDGADPKQADDTFDEYVKLSRAQRTRASGENVTLLSSEEGNMFSEVDRNHDGVDYEPLSA